MDILKTRSRLQRIFYSVILLPAFLISLLTQVPENQFAAGRPGFPDSQSYGISGPYAGQSWRIYTPVIATAGRPQAGSDPTFARLHPSPTAAEPVVSDRFAGEAALVDALQQGGYVVYFRHAATNRAERDANTINLEDCHTQRTLSQQGRNEAREIGQAFRILAIPIGEVLSSGYCRTRETGLLAFGWVRVVEGLTGLPPDEQMERKVAVERMLSTPPAPGENTILIGHAESLALTAGIMIGEGEAAIISPQGRQNYSIVGRIQPSEWVEFAGSISNSPVDGQAECVFVDQTQGGEPAGMGDHQGPSMDMSGGSVEMPCPENPAVTSELPAAAASPESSDTAQVAVDAFQSEPAPASLVSDPDLLLPDLQTLAPTSIIYQVIRRNEIELILFTNTIVNAGSGPLEIEGIHEDGKTSVIQRIHSVDGSFVEQHAGEFVYHPTHNHWHFGNFARYEIWSLTPTGEFDTLISVSDKVSYCLRDNYPVYPNLPNASPHGAYTICEVGTQGISVGWVDVYAFDTPGQTIDITYVPAGVYALRSVTDPNNQLWEADDTNNDVTIYVEIFADGVKVINDPTILSSLFEKTNPEEGS
jgi:phosphohistidine phosphatase SixA